jgi:hypothetical protein
MFSASQLSSTCYWHIVVYCPAFSQPKSTVCLLCHKKRRPENISCATAQLSKLWGSVVSMSHKTPSHSSYDLDTIYLIEDKKRCCSISWTAENFSWTRLPVLLNVPQWTYIWCVVHTRCVCVRAPVRACVCNIKKGYTCIGLRITKSEGNYLYIFPYQVLPPTRFIGRQSVSAIWSCLGSLK